jgi:ubiquinone/menaquinone biosynthesis C-methylase UbiE
MTQPSPLARPDAWNLVTPGYVDEVVPQFEPFARDVLDLASVSAGTRVCDVACGPGTLSFLAAQRGARVQALDFASNMLDALRARAQREGVTTIECQQGDGMALPYADRSFDAGFSMFGLMFFPDRARGFAELRRVLEPGARAVVTSWPPMDRVPLLSALFATMAELLPDMPSGKSKPALGEPEELRDEMREAGFESVEVHELAHSIVWPSVEVWWTSTRRSAAPMVLLEQSMGPAFEQLAPQLLAGLQAKVGAGPQVVTLRAWAGVGVA